MSRYRLGRSSRRHLAGVHQDLVILASTAIADSRCPCDFTILPTGGRRTLEQQRRLVESGASKTLNSRHVTGHAVDLVVWRGRDVSWDWAYYEQLAEHIKRVARELGITVEWGGDWAGFRDGPHWQLPWSVR